MLQFRHQAVAEQRGIRFRVGTGLPVLRLGLGDQRLLRQQRGGRVGICTLETGFGAQQLQARVHDLLRQRGVLQFEDHVVGLHLRAGPQQDSGDAAVGARGNPGGVDRHEGAGAAHLTDQFTPGDGVEPERAAVDRSARPEPSASRWRRRRWRGRARPGARACAASVGGDLLAESMEHQARRQPNAKSAPTSFRPPGPCRKRSASPSRPDSGIRRRAGGTRPVARRWRGSPST